MFFQALKIRTYCNDSFIGFRYSKQDLPDFNSIENNKSESESSEDEDIQDEATPSYTVSNLRSQFLEKVKLDLPLDQTNSSISGESSRKNSLGGRSAIIKARKKSKATARIKPVASASSAVNQTPHPSSDKKKAFGASKFGAPTAVLPMLLKAESTGDVQSRPNKSLYGSEISGSNDDVSNVSDARRKMSSIQQRIEQLKMKSTDSLSEQLKMKSTDSLSSQTSVETPNIRNTSQSNTSRDSCFSDSDVSSIRLSTESTFSQSPFPVHKPEDNQMGVDNQTEGSMEGVRVEPEKETPTSKVYKVALEILTTEIHYVKILGLIETVSG